MTFILFFYINIFGKESNTRQRIKEHSIFFAAFFIAGQFNGAEVIICVIFLWILYKKRADN